MRTLPIIIIALTKIDVFMTFLINRRTLYVKLFAGKINYYRRKKLGLLLRYICTCYEVLLVNLHSQKFMRKRNKAVTLMLIPIAIFLWYIGWSLYWIGSKTITTRPMPKSKLPAQELIIFVPTPEQKYAT